MRVMNPYWVSAGLAHRTAARSAAPALSRAAAAIRDGRGASAALCWGSDALGLGKAGPIEAFLPPVTLAILFGLSMDYQVFLVSRINEEWVYGRNSRRAIRTGQTHTARVITAAATIMICVFLAFALTGQRDIAEFGISLAAAVALDAFILRTVLVPAAMHLFGDANWWLPRWKDRLLPHLAIEPPTDTAAPALR